MGPSSNSGKRGLNRQGAKTPRQENTPRIRRITLRIFRPRRLCALVVQLSCFFIRL
jgi:hypothetical protein